MDTTRHGALLAALAAPGSSTRLRAALAAGTRPAPDLVEPLLTRCATEPDFFVRDMLTWALTRHPAELTVPRLLDEVTSDVPQARSQALHTLSKIRDARAWSGLPAGWLHDAEDEAARSAWRAAVVLVPVGEEAELVGELVRELGRGDRDTRLSLSRALVALAERAPAAVEDALGEAAVSSDPAVRGHARATERLLLDPDAEFADAQDEATRTVLLTGAPRPEPRC
ncbi:MAG TPA: hypothetical protein VKZ83_04100 [Phototrophicaceae bacterium]|nr:hypothetical protein [Phototrophicaceae bacterium]